MTNQWIQKRIDERVIRPDAFDAVRRSPGDYRVNVPADFRIIHKLGLFDDCWKWISDVFHSRSLRMDSPGRTKLTDQELERGRLLRQADLEDDNSGTISIYLASTPNNRAMAVRP